MKLTDALSLVGVVAVVAVLLFAGRHGPLKPVARALGAEPTLADYAVTAPEAAPVSGAIVGQDDRPRVAADSTLALQPKR